MDLFPPRASTIAGQVDTLFLVLIGLSGFFSLAVLALIIYFGVKYRKGTRADRSNPPTASLKVEIAWILGLLVLSLGTYSYATLLYYRITRPPQQALEIYVLGLQWMWKVQHPQGVAEINELHVPVNTQVRLIMTSEDVIHSFFLPAFRLKYDTIPGRYTSLWFEANQTGDFPIYCAEYCGTDHSRMIGRIFVMEPREYEAWLSSGGARTPPTGGAPGAPPAEAPAGNGSLAQQGEALFQELGCTGCHIAGSSDRAPDLTGIFGQQEQLAGGSTVTVDETYLRQSILQPQEQIVEGFDPIMPSYQGRVNEEQLVLLVEYIKSLGGEE